MADKPNVSPDTLRKLHRIHQQLADLRDRLQRGPRRIAVRDANVKRHEEQLTQVRDQGRTMRVALDTKSGDLKSKEARVADWRIKLNQAKSNAEFQALKEQIAASEAANSVLEDEILEAMDRIEAFKQSIADAEVNLAKARDEAQKARAEFEAQEPLIREDVKRLQEELELTEATLPTEVRDVYFRAVRARGENALAPVVERTYCASCNFQLRTNTIADLMMQRPHFCDSCGAMLYFPEERSVGTPAGDDDE